MVQVNNMSFPEVSQCS